MASNPDIRKQSKTIIFNVYNYFKELVASKPDAKIKDIFKQTQLIAAEACGVSLRTVGRICAEAGKINIESPSFSSPQKKISHVKRVTDLDDFDKNIVRRTVQEFYDRGEYPTCIKLKEILEQKIQFSGCMKSLWIILKNLGFKYKKCNDGRKFLMERGDIVAARIAFLRKMHNIRKESPLRPIIYLDETWVNQNHSKKYIWQDSTSSGGLKVPTGKGSRLIVCHAGSAQHGFINGADLIFQSNSTKDYHHEMNSDVFREWFTELLRTLEEPCVIVMDNASYHSNHLEKIPSTKTRKYDIIAWLESKNIMHNPNNTVPELLSIVKRNKEKYKMYELDALAYEMGHEVVRLPPYHCQYNPIELIWAQVKNEIAAKNNTFKIKDVKCLLEEALCRVTVEDWKKCVEHSEKLQEEDFEKEGIRDEIMQQIVINLQDDSETSCSDNDSEFEV